MDLTPEEKVDLEGCVYLIKKGCITLAIGAVLWILALAGIAYIIYGRG